MPTEAQARRRTRRVHLTINEKPISVPPGTTILRAAELALVAIPSLCSHEELSAFGGCRLCTVEIAGVNGYPLACSTVVGEGMQVTTDSADLREMHREVLQLILSQHPASCLLCDEADECRRSQSTIRKAGVSTGCRSCPNDGDCELQRVVDLVGVHEIEYPIAYRGLEPEHDDPFFDRDYNLCILCGRCVRMCDEVRGTGVLSFKYRGPQTLIGPALTASHVAAGCEFCGACVGVCPTGALADKVSKWDGRPDGVAISTCPFCGLGCRLELAHRGGRLVRVHGARDAALNDGQLCLRGSFCLPETTHHFSRARKPMLKHGAYFREVSWDEVLGEVAERLRAVAPDDVRMVLSNDLTNEGLFAAQRLAREGLGSQGVAAAADAVLPGGPAAWSRLFSLPVSLQALSAAEAVIAAGFDSRFSFSVAGVQVRRALRRGARLVTVDARETNLARMADTWLPVDPGDEARALAWLARRLSGGEAPPARPHGADEPSLAAAAQLLEGAATLAVVIGPRVFDGFDVDELVAALEALAAGEGTTVLPLVNGANARGALELGALAGVLPGPRTAAPRAGGRRAARRRPAVLYLVGDTGSTARPDADFVIAQGLFLPPFDVDAFLPAASFAEAEGTLTNLEGRVQELAPVEKLPPGAVHGYALPDWRIFSDLAGRLGRPELEYDGAKAVRTAIRAEVPGFPAEGDRSPRRMAPLKATGGTPAAAGGGAPKGTGRFVLVPERPSFRHRGGDLAAVVEGLAELHLEEGLSMNADDMARLGVEADGAVTVRLPGGSRVFPARPDPGCPRGTAYATVPATWDGAARTGSGAVAGGKAGAGPPEADSRAHPMRVRISAGDRTRASRPAEAAAPAAQPPRAAAGAAHARPRRGGDHG